MSTVRPRLHLVGNRRRHRLPLDVTTRILVGVSIGDLGLRLAVSENLALRLPTLGILLGRTGELIVAVPVRRLRILLRSSIRIGKSLRNRQSLQ